jgi:TolA-binding protein
LFQEAEDEVWNSPDLRLRGRNFLLPITVPPQSKAKFTTVIEKCSKLLQYHPESNLVDDALLMIGKSYFYQAEFLQAERKFNELIQGYPNGSLATESKLMLAYTYYQIDKRDSATAMASQVIEIGTKEGKDRLVSEAAMILGKIELGDKDYRAAQGHYQRAAETAVDAEQRSAAYLTLGDVYNAESDYANAEKAYQRAEQTANNYLGEYRGRIGRIRMANKLGRYESGLQDLRELRSNVNYKEFFGEIDLETANTFRDERDYTSAIDEYIYVDSAYARTEYASRAAYHLGLMYERKLGWYDSARVVFNKARGYTNVEGVTPEIMRHADYLNKYVQFSKDLAKYDSLRHDLLTPRDSVATAVDTLRKDSTGALLSAGKDSLKSTMPVAPPLPLDSVDARLAYNMNELATLFYTSIGRIDSARIWYSRVVTRFPKSTVVPRALFSLAQIFREDTTVSRDFSDSLYREIVRQFPRSEFAVAAGRILGMPVTPPDTDRAEILYAQGEQALEKKDYAAAIRTFHSVVENHPKSPLASKAQYAIGWIYEQEMSLPDSAIASYQKLVKLFPSSAYAARVQPLLAEVEVAKKAAQAAARADTTAPTSLKPPDEKKKPVEKGEELPDVRKQPKVPDTPEQMPHPTKAPTEEKVPR